MDDREVRDALERAQARLKVALAQVEELEQRKRVAEVNEQQHRAQVSALEERVRSLEAALSRATSLRMVQADDAQRQRLAEQLVSTQDQLRALEQRLTEADRQLPRLPPSNACGKCGRRMLPPVELRGEVTVTLAVDLEPSAFLRDVVHTALRAHTCEGCGFVELFASDPKALAEAISSVRKA